MIETSFDLLEKFRPTTAYTHSDEITLIFPALTEEDKKNGTTLSFNGRIQKFATLLASYCSIRFNYHIQKQPSFPDDKPIVFIFIFLLLSSKIILLFALYFIFINILFLFIIFLF